MYNKELVKQREDFEKLVFQQVKQASKGSGWRKSRDSLSRSENGLFFDAHFRCHYDDHMTDFWFVAKPLRIDEIFWDVMQMPENRDQPLSFRAHAWFKCVVPHTSVLSVGDKKLDAPRLAQKFLSYASENLISFQKTYDLATYINAIERDPEQIERGNYSTALFCLYCANGNSDKARHFAQEHVSGKRECGSTYKTIDQDFFELALEYLDGPRKKSVWKFW